MPNFEVFRHRHQTVARNASVSIGQGGKEYILNLQAFEALGEPQAVEFLYDPKERIIGLRPVDPAAIHAYPVRKSRTSSSRKVTGWGFSTRNKIPTEVARRYQATVQDGTLLVDLKQVPIVTGGIRERNGPGRHRDPEPALGG